MYFDCPTLSARLTTEACARQRQQAAKRDGVYHTVVANTPTLISRGRCKSCTDAERARFHAKLIPASEVEGAVAAAPEQPKLSRFNYVAWRKAVGYGEKVQVGDDD